MLNEFGDCANDGVPNPRAFPSAAIDPAFGGMTLRDWFAGRVASQCIRNALQDDGGWDADNVAYHAYLIADALLAQRTKP